MNKQRKAAFSYIESELFHLPETRKEIERLREELIYGTNTDENIGGGKSNLPGDPTGNRVVVLLSNRKLQRMEDMVRAIESVYEKLPDDRRKLMQLYYWTKPRTLTWEGIAIKLERDRATVIRWRNEIVKAIGELSGM